MQLKQAEVIPQPWRGRFWRLSAMPPYNPKAMSGGVGSTHLIAHHHVDARGALPVDSMDMLGGDAVQVGDLLNQLQGGQLFQEDGVVH